MEYQDTLFDVEAIQSKLGPAGGSGSEIGYLREVIPVVEALGAQIGQTDSETSGFFRITIKPGVFFFEPRWEKTGLVGDVTITTRSYRGRPEDNLSHFSKQKRTRINTTEEGFLMAVGRDACDQKLYAVFYADCTDTEPSMFCVDLLDVETIEKYSDVAQTVMAMYQNALVDGSTAVYPRARREGWSEVFSAEQMQHIIDRYWPEPDLVYRAPGTTQ